MAGGSNADSFKRVEGTQQQNDSDVWISLAVRRTFPTTFPGNDQQSKAIAIFEQLAGRNFEPANNKTIAQRDVGESVPPGTLGSLQITNDREVALLDAAINMAQRKNYPGAEVISNDLLKLREEHYGKNSGPVASSFTLLGDICSEDFRFATAKDYYRRGAEVSKVAFGDKDNVMTALNTEGMARADTKLGNFKDADKEYREALRIYEKSNIPKLSDARVADIAKTYLEHAAVLQNLGNTEEAFKQLRKGQNLVRMLQDRIDKTGDGDRG
jgi:tetratricopeptide (TPR) repeat protein